MPLTFKREINEQHLNDVMEDMCEMYYDIRKIEENMSKLQSNILELRLHMLSSNRILWNIVHNINTTKIHRHRKHK